MKKIMILGGNPETAVLVNTSLSMGLHTIVVDMGHGSPAKKHASESYDINVFNVDEIVALAKKLRVDAVLVGVADILVKPYREICQRLDLPCYVTEKAVEAFCSKDGFKKYCSEYDIQDIPGIYLGRDSEIIKPSDVDYPLMIKPVDSGGGVGMKICWDDQDYRESVKTALKFSKKGVVLVEKYMDCDDMAAYYTFRKGVPYISALSDRFTTKKQGDSSPVCIGAVYPSKYTDLFVRTVHPKLCELFKGLNIRDGVLNIQFFVEDDVIYAYDPGFRLQGEAPDFHMARINGFDHRKMLLDYAFTGELGDEDFAEKNDYLFEGKKACTIWVLLKSGEIGSIRGLDAIEGHENVHFVLQRFEVGDSVEEDWLGTEKQVFARIYLVADSIGEVNQLIGSFGNLLKIEDNEGEDMILEWLQPLDERDYK
ncbi:carbamoyl-phosphate-synthetase [Robiginitalea sp. SC105]|uniref:ATP-binding protein n=1 Tax=Robiginitalea sp. SC105 TaxID=2762332 RepID=UPI00163A27B7|nr:carbamoyl-phosphate-synthetase [Robiginitalea sp. SC105]MBC2840324.1 carbamoyl-phosphate-synthetase [Robiginitalea sp. SC105]